MRLLRPRRLIHLIRAFSAWLLVLLASAAVLPGSLAAADTRPALAGAEAGSAAAAGGADPATAEDLARERRAWQDGRRASGRAAADRAAADRVARGSGATAATPATAAWIVPAGADQTIPPLALRAYRAAASWASGYDPGCRLSWSVVAGIGRIESNHGRHAGARFGPSGDVTPPILGPALDGRGGVATIRDSDGGRLDGDRVWDRAVGPMQFIPSTWRSLGRDGNGDRVASPGNLFDATVSAAAYLCLGGGGDLADPARLRRAVYGYNHSWSYVDSVLGWAAFYAQRISGGPGVLPQLPPATTVPSTSLSATTRPAASTTPAAATTRSATTTRPATTRPVTTTPASSTTRPTSTTTPTTTRPPTSTTTTTGPTSTTAPATTRPTSTTTPCAPPTTLPPGSTTTTTTTTTTTGPTSTTLPPCPTSTTVGGSPP